MLKIQPLLDPIVDRIVRRRFPLDQVPTDRYQIRVARGGEELRAALRLVQYAYVYQGIAPVETCTLDDLRLTEQHLLSKATVLVAFEGNQLVGTVTLTQDSGAGLPLDSDFPDELKALREGATLIGEIGSLAIVKRCWGTGVAPLLAMATARLAWSRGMSHTVLGIHPKAERFFSALWCYRRLGNVRRHSSLHAPTVGLACNLEEGQRHFLKHHRRPMQSGYRPHEHICEGVPHPAIDLSPAPGASNGKLPRPLLSDLYRHRQRMAPVHSSTLRELRKERSDETMTHLALETAATR